MTPPPGDEMTSASLSERLVRMEGKIDAYAAGQNAVLQEHGRRLDGHDKDIRDLREADKPVRTSGWQVAAVVIAALVAVSSLLIALLTN